MACEIVNKLREVSVYLWFDIRQIAAVDLGYIVNEETKTRIFEISGVSPYIP